MLRWRLDTTERSEEMASESTYWRDPALGEASEVDLAACRLRYF
jgi:hypothetical protein